MKNYFIKLFDYDISTNLRLIALLNKGERIEAGVRLMSHLLASQQVWLKRCEGTMTTKDAIWPEWPLEGLHKIAVVSHSNWINFIKSLTDYDFEKSIVYQNTKGISFTNQLDDILAHLINHGTHHRAQIGQQLKIASLSVLPATDYIFYRRDREKWN